MTLEPDHRLPNWPRRVAVHYRNLLEILRKTPVLLIQCARPEYAEEIYDIINAMTIMDEEARQEVIRMFDEAEAEWKRRNADN